MRVRCVAEPPYEGIAPLEIGSEHVVIAIDVPIRDLPDLRLHDPAGRPPCYWSPMFETVSDAVPSNWTIHIDPDGCLQICPEPWRDFFWDKYYDRAAGTRETYDRELAVILSES